MELHAPDVARLFVGAAVLAFASWTDLRWRRAPDILWVVAGGAGLLLLGFDLAAIPEGLAAPGRVLYLALALVFAGLMFACYWLGLLAGGADAKALMALALLLPFPLHLGAFPLAASGLPPVFGVLGNALIVFLAVPLAMLARNVARGHAQLPHALLGLRMPVAEARARHAWPMEYVQDGQVRTAWMPSRYVWTEEDWDALAAAGRSEVWVTPKVPFMVPLLAGFVLVFFAGDLLSGWLLPIPPLAGTV